MRERFLIGVARLWHETHSFTPAITRLHDIKLQEIELFLVKVKNHFGQVLNRCAKQLSILMLPGHHLRMVRLFCINMDPDII